MELSLAQRVQSCRDYIHALEEERKKIQVFQRELPLCLQLVTQAIESVRQQMVCGGGGFGDDEEMMSEAVAPVLEEFIPLRPSYSSSEDDGSVHEEKKSVAVVADKKPDWLKSVQLWNHQPDSSPEVEPPKKPVAVDVKKIGGAFHPFDREKHVVAKAVSAAVSTAVPMTSASSGGARGGDGSGCADDHGSEEKVEMAEKEKEEQSQAHKKTRRCWSQELHRRFLHALEQLGGSHVATPKQIRELMEVDGLTNDEVKSHLQKYRLHTRRPTPTAQSSSSNSNPRAPQFVVVGGIWVPPADYAAAVAAAAHPTKSLCAASAGVYAPIASLPKDLRFHQQVKKHAHRSPTGPLHSEDRCGGQAKSAAGDEEATHSASPATSFSSHTTTASPPY